jgi:hypothetical protein
MSKSKRVELWGRQLWEHNGVSEYSNMSDIVCRLHEDGNYQFVGAQVFKKAPKQCNFILVYDNEFAEIDDYVAKLPVGNSE